MNLNFYYLIKVPKNWFHDRDEVSGSSEVCDVKQALQLLQGNGDCRTCHEAYNGRMR